MIAEASPNIALIKYWGKQATTSDAERNLALNASLSLTLSHAVTRTRVKRLSEGDSEVRIEGARAKPEDREKVLAHLRRIEDYVSPEGAVRNSWLVESRSNFPPGTGLASSASAFAALTLAGLGELLGIDRAGAFLHYPELADFSALARRGSGSACRSVCGGFMKWEGSSAHPILSEWMLLDTVVIFSRAPKAISSSEGHAAALKSPHFAERLQQLPERLASVEAALRRKDLQALGALIEAEALELHRIAETGQPAARYLSAETRILIAALQKMPKRDFFFTIDAGPNVHLISERPIAKEVGRILLDHNLRAEIWQDGRGEGPRLTDDEAGA